MTVWLQLATNMNKPHTDLMKNTTTHSHVLRKEPAGFLRAYAGTTRRGLQIHHRYVRRSRRRRVGLVSIT